MVSMKAWKEGERTVIRGDLTQFDLAMIELYYRSTEVKVTPEYVEVTGIFDPVVPIR